MKSRNQKIRVAAVADLHYSKSSQGKAQQLFAGINDQADMLLLPGDLTDYGLPEEAHLLAKDLHSVVNIPVIAILGNHDYESNMQEEVKEVFLEAGMTILDGDACEIKGVGLAGVKGFGGGFGRYSLGFWGEPMIKEFVQEAINESLKLEAALARLRTRHRIAMLHYSPIKATVEGEPEEIFPYLGSRRLEEPLHRFPVTAVLHGHAHKGHLEGATSDGVPVYNVSMSLLQHAFPGKPPYRLLELDVEDVVPVEAQE